LIVELIFVDYAIVLNISLLEERISQYFYGVLFIRHRRKNM